MSQQAPDDALFELALYLASTSLACLGEPIIYASFRMVEGASRLIAAAEEIEGLEADAFLRKARESIEQNKIRMIDDREGYLEWLTGFVREFASEAVRRNLQAS